MPTLIAVPSLRADMPGAAAPRIPYPDADRGEPCGDIEPLVAANLARLRSQRNLSLDALARLSGVSRAMLAQIEAGRSTPTIRVLHRVASALQVSVSAFLRDFAFDGIALLPAHASPRMVSANGAVASRSLFPAHRLDRAQFHEIRLQPFALETLAALPPGASKNLVVAHGMLEIHARDRRQLLGPGDAIFFDADQPHSYRNTSDSDAAAYVVTHHPENSHG